MRAIKFRAWSKKEKRMYWNVQAAYDTLHCHNIEDDSKDCSCGPLAHDFIYSSFGCVLNDPGNIIVMQFTGLTDKNGREIYEGDILCKDFSGGEKSHRAVIWGTSCGCCATVHGWDEPMGQYVAGNVHETPELIK